MNLALLLALAPLAAAQSSIDAPVVRAGAGERMDAWLSALVPFGFSGTALAAKDGEVLLAKGYGLADRAKGVPMGVDTVISLGSITKQLTAAAILALEADGHLSVTDPIGEHLDGVPADKRGITLHHLLTHTAGLRSDFAETDFSPVGRDEYVRRALASELLFEPGTRMEYANSGYSLLGAIVERVSDKGYEEYLAERLLEPAGMRDTGYLRPRWAPERVARGYDGEGEWGTVLERPWAPDGPWWGLRANGGIHSTIGDVWRWDRALATDRVLPAAQRAKLETPHVVEGDSGWHYGYGWAIATTLRRTKLVTHNGSNGIFFADLLRFVDEDALLYVATNARPHAGQVTAPLERLLFGGEVPAPPALAEFDPAELERWAGEYALVDAAEAERSGRGAASVSASASAAGEVLRVTAGDGVLHLEGSGPRAFALALRGDAGAAERFDERVERTRRMFEGSLAGEWEEMHAAFGTDEPLESFAERHEGLRARWQAEHGELREFAALGAGAGGPPRTWLRLDFERGALWLEHRWGPDGDVQGFLVRAEAPRRALHPVAADRFVAWDLERGVELEVRFERGDAGATRLVVNGRVVATR